MTVTHRIKMDTDWIREILYNNRTVMHPLTEKNSRIRAVLDATGEFSHLDIALDPPSVCKCYDEE